MKTKPLGILAFYSISLAMSSAWAGQLPATAGGGGGEFDLEKEISSMFETDPSAESDLQIQLTKDASRRIMTQLLAELEFISETSACRETIKLLFETNRFDALVMVSHNQEYQSDYSSHYTDSGAIVDFIINYDSWSDLEMNTACAFMLGKVNGSISALESVFYKPLIELKTGTKSEEIARAIANEIIRREFR